MTGTNDAARTTISSRPNPYVGTRPLKRGEPIYGREQETAELLDLLIAERIVLLYSPSGAGKSSLLNAAILPKMEENGFGGAAGGAPEPRTPPEAAAVPTFNRYVYSVLVCLEEGLPPEKRFDPAELAGLRLREYLLRRQRAREREADADDSRARLLVIDQAEEIITIDPAAPRPKTGIFFNQLGEAARDHQFVAPCSRCAKITWRA